MAVGADAIESGLVQSLSRPGGNLTGMTILTPEISAKRLELLKEAVPRITRGQFSSVGAVLILGCTFDRRRPRPDHWV